MEISDIRVVDFLTDNLLIFKLCIALSYFNYMHVGPGLNVSSQHQWPNNK